MLHLRPMRSPRIPVGISITKVATKRMDSSSPIWAVVKPRSFKKSMKIARLKARLTKKVYRLYFQRFFLVSFISVPYLITGKKGRQFLATDTGSAFQEHQSPDQTKRDPLKLILLRFMASNPAIIKAYNSQTS